MVCHEGLDCGWRKIHRKNLGLVGDISTARIIINDGAHFKGSIEIGATESVVNPPNLRIVRPTKGPWKWEPVALVPASASLRIGRIDF